VSLIAPFKFDPLFPGGVESYKCRREAYLTDYRIEPGKLLWDVEMSIKIADDKPATGS
jgi:hypothetical protein